MRRLHEAIRLTARIASACRSSLLRNAISRRVSSCVRWRNSPNSRAFSIAITANAAKFCSSAICLSVKGRDLLAVGGDDAEQCAVFTQRHDKQGANAAEIDGGARQRLTWVLRGDLR